MPAKQTKCVSVTVRPRDGITQKEVAALGKWVADLEKLKATAAVIEKPNTDAAHVHIGLLFDDETTSQNIYRRLLTIFQTEIKAGGRWEFPKIAIVCRAHHSFSGLVGGYYTKDDDRHELWTKGITEDQLNAGKEERDEAINKQKQKNCSQSTLIYELRKIYDEFKMIYKEDEEWNDDHPTGATAQECLEELILRGFLNYLIHWGKMKKSIEANWGTIIESKR